MATINFDSKAVKKQAKLLEEAADQIQSQTVKVMNAANEALAASWSGKAGEMFVEFMQEQSKVLSSQTASLKEVAAFLRDACTSMEKAEAQAKAVVSKR
ncbi:MAG: WXG100 family type VII secretion target [Suilimivivens sp.]